MHLTSQYGLLFNPENTLSSPVISSSKQKQKHRPVEFKAIPRSLRGCLVCDFKQSFSVFKQYFTYFNALFHPHVFSQLFSNNNFQFLNTCTKRTLNLCGKKFGSCHSLAKSEISFGEPVETRFRQWKTWTAAAWLIARYAPSIHNMMRTYFTLHGLVRASHRSGMKTCNGVSRTTWPSRIFFS